MTNHNTSSVFLFGRLSQKLSISPTKFEENNDNILRTSAPRMMVILRQGFRRISRCPLGVVKLCLSLFLGLYQFIMRRNDQNKPEVVDYFEGKTSFDSMWQNRFDLSWISVIFLIILLNLTLPTTYRYFTTYQSLLANNCTVNFLSIISYFYFISNSVTGHHSKQWLSAFLIFSFPAALAH